MSVGRGETRLDNLISLCKFHHASLHKGEYRIHLDEDEEHFVFTNSRNKVIRQALYPQFPASKQRDPAQLGLEGIDKRAGESRWDGGRMDIHQAITCLYQATDGV